MGGGGRKAPAHSFLDRRADFFTILHSVVREAGGWRMEIKIFTLRSEQDVRNFGSRRRAKNSSAPLDCIYLSPIHQCILM